MKIMKKLTAYAIALTLVCTSMSVPAFAGDGPNSWAYICIADGPNPSDWVDVYAKDPHSPTTTVEGVSYDEAKNTLTLNNYSSPDTIIITNGMGYAFKINVKGTNRIQQISAYGAGDAGSVSLTGSGKLFINEDKKSDIAIYLDAEESAARLKVSSDLTLKAFGQPGCPSAYVDHSSATNKGIVFDGRTAMNNSVVKENSAETCGAILAESTDFYSCTPKPGTEYPDTKIYGARQNQGFGGSAPSYEIYEITTDGDLGNIAMWLDDAQGNPADPDDFDIGPSPTISAIDASGPRWKMFIYTKIGDTSFTQYACHINNTDQGKSYSMYTLVDKSAYRGLFAIPAPGEQDLSAIPDGYSEAKSPDFYSYSYDSEIIDLGAVSSVKLSATGYTYNGKARKPSVTVKNSYGAVLKSGTDYTVSYAKGRKNVGKYAVKVTYKGKYVGSKTLYFKINPKGTKLSKLTPGKKKITVKWKKRTTQTTGYQIMYSTSKSFKKNNKTVTISKNKTTKKTISKLKAKKKYYVKIRTYKTVKVSGKNTKFYSSWSSKKAATTKK